MELLALCPRAPDGLGAVPRTPDELGEVSSSELDDAANEPSLFFPGAAPSEDHPDLGEEPTLDLGPLTRRVARQQPPAARGHLDAQRIVEEYARYFELKMISDDFSDNKLAAPDSLQQIWCLHAQDPHSFVQDCSTMQARVSWLRKSKGWTSIDLEVRKRLLLLTSDQRQTLSRALVEKRGLRDTGLPPNTASMVFTDIKRIWHRFDTGDFDYLTLEQLLSLQPEEMTTLGKLDHSWALHPCGLTNVDATEIVKAERRASSWRAFRARWGIVSQVWEGCAPLNLDSLLGMVCGNMECLGLVLQFAGFGVTLRLSTCMGGLLRDRQDFFQALKSAVRMQPDLTRISSLANFGNAADRAAWWSCWQALQGLLEAGIRPVWPRDIARNAMSICPTLLPLLLAGTDSTLKCLRRSIFLDAVADANVEAVVALANRWPMLLQERDLRYWPRLTAVDIAVQAGEEALAHKLLRIIDQA